VHYSSGHVHCWDDVTKQPNVKSHVENYGMLLFSTLAKSVNHLLIFDKNVLDINFVCTFTITLLLVIIIINIIISSLFY